VVPRLWLALSLAELGQFPEAVSEAERAVAEAEATEEPHTLCNAILVLGRIFLLRGQPEQAIPPLERSLSLAGAWHIGLLQPSAPLSYAYLLAGRLAALRELWPPPLPTRIANSAGVMVERGECLLGLGHTEEACDFAHNALDLARQVGERGHEARALALMATVEARRLGVASRRSGELHDQATARAEDLGMRPLVGRCQLYAGCRWLAMGNRARAREHLQRAAATFHELDMACWLARAESALGGQAGTTEARSAP
jgi:tetratricopeptide (TPR) repeat protein